MLRQRNHRVIIGFACVVAALVAYYPRRIFSASRAPRQLSIGVIGAGLAGLTAAYRLQQQGHDVTVYEARDRVGGRTFTWREADGSYEELGGSNIRDGGKAVEMRTLLAECNLPTIIKTGAYAPWMYNEHRELRDLKDVFWGLREPGDLFYAELEKIAETASSLEEPLAFLAQGNADAEYFLLANMRDVGFDGASAPASLIYGFYHLYQEIHKAISNNTVPTETLEYVKGGNDMLAQCLAEKLTNAVLQSTPVTEIKASAGDKLVVVYGSGNEAVHDKIICAVPCGALAHIAIDETIVPADQREEWLGRYADIIKTPYAVVTKMLFRVATAKPSSTGLPPLQTVSMPYFNAYMPEGEMWHNVDGSILTYYITRPESTHVTRETFDDIGARYAQQIQERFPFLKRVMPVAWVDWEHEPYSRGTWATRGKDQDMAYAVTVEEVYGEQHLRAFLPVANKLYFAGEHTVFGEGNGCMAGAVSSGERVADIIAQECKAI